MIGTPGSRREVVLEALRAAPDGVSGEALAERLGVSRVAVRKHVAALQSSGYEIEARAGVGYRLIAIPDALLPAEVGAALKSPMWVRIEGGGTTGSTNADAKVLVAAGAPEGTVVVASGQTGGRGRFGREWASPVGGAYLSAVLRPAMSPERVSALSLAIGVGVAEGLGSLGVPVGLKWPNDVVGLGVDGAPRGKLAGILLEAMTEGESVAWVVAGVGVNVRGCAFKGAACVDEVVSTTLAAVAAAVLDGIAVAYADLVRGGFDALAERYRRLDVLAGSEVVVSDAAGRVVTAGTVSGVDGQGRLVVRGESGEVAVSSGEVTLRRA